MSDPARKNIVTRFIQLFPENVRLVVSICILSMAAALSAVFFLFMTNFLFSQTYTLFAAKGTLYFVVASFVVISVSSLLVGYLLNVFSPDAAGSGIPQMKAAYWKELGYISIKPVIVKFVAGVLSIGGGNSLGREGPSVFIGSGVASNLDGLTGASNRQRRSATLIGASAGLAAAFNTPLAAIAFIIEEVVGDLNNRYLGHVVLSSVIGAFVVYALLGRQPAFALPIVENISWFHYLAVPVVALVASFAGVAFQRSTLSIRGRLKKQSRIPVWLLPLFGGLVTWGIGSSVFVLTGKIGVFGLGYQDLSNALNNNFEWKIAGLLMLAKLAATIAGYSFGGCGGIFAPSLFIGGLSGFFIAGVAGLIMPLTPSDHIILTAVGMSACMGAIVRAPLTSILIVFEMTHQFTMIPGLMIGMIISQFVASRWGELNFYDALLVQDGHELHKVRPPIDLQSWQNLPISAIANPQIVSIKNLTEVELREIVATYPYRAFPIIVDGSAQGIVTRAQIEDALQKQKLPEVHEVGFCYSEQTVKEVGNTFVESTVPVLLVLDRNTKEIQGIITLHDLIRAQAAIQN